MLSSFSNHVLLFMIFLLRQMLLSHNTSIFYTIKEDTFCIPKERCQNKVQYLIEKQTGQRCFLVQGHSNTEAMQYPEPSPLVCFSTARERVQFPGHKQELLIPAASKKLTGALVTQCNIFYFTSTACQKTAPMQALCGSSFRIPSPR